MGRGERTAADAERVEALIERGLERYGEGNFDGALEAWERALELDPDNQRAGEYVEYLRRNLDALTGGPASAEADIPFGIDELGDSGEYDMVEVDVRRGPAPPRLDSLDQGWILDDESLSGASAATALPPPPAEAPEPNGGLTGELDLAELGHDIMAGVPGYDDDEAFGGPGLAPPDGDGDDADDEPSYQDGIIELEAEPPDPSEIHDFSVDETFDAGFEPTTGGALDLPDEPSKGDFSPGLTQERTIELDSARRTSSGLLDLSDVDDGEITAPGGEEPLPRETAPALSRAALDALGAVEGHAPFAAGEGTGGGAAAGTGAMPADLELGELDELSFGAARDDRALDDDEPRVSFRSGPTGVAARTSQRGATEDGELTVERRMATARDEEETVERGQTWSGLLELEESGAEPLDEATREHAARGFALDDTVQLDDGLRLEQATRAQSDFDVDAVTGELRQDRGPAPPDLDVGLPDDDQPVAAYVAQLLDELERDAPAGEPADERTRRRVAALIKRAESNSNLGRHTLAVAAVDLALEEDPDSAVAQKVIHRHRDLLFEIYRSYLGDMRAMPSLAIPLHQLAEEQLDARAAFLLSRIDGTLSFEEILDVSGMSRLEAYRVLSKMLLRGILQVH